MAAPPAIAVKALIVDRAGRILMLKRHEGDTHRPGTWDLPGGRLEAGEDPIGGLKREVLEESGLSVRAGPPTSVHHFTKDDGQVTTMIVFLCRPRAGAVKIRLSDEHTAFRWEKPSEAEKLLTRLGRDARIYAKLFAGRERLARFV